MYLKKVSRHAHDVMNSVHWWIVNARKVEAEKKDKRTMSVGSQYKLIWLRYVKSKNVEVLIDSLISDADFFLSRVYDECYEDTKCCKAISYRRLCKQFI